jgi:predicted transcriptional regulator
MSQNEGSKQSTGMAVIAEVADALASSAPTVRSRLVQALTERELARRVDLLDKALVKRDQVAKEVYMVKKPGKPNNKVVAADGSVTETPAVYTPEEYKKLEEDTKKYQKALKEANEKLAKFDALLEAAFTEPSDKVFEKLEKQVKGGGGSSNDSSEE